MTTALIIIFNHRYDANLPKLRNLYKEKFSKILFLMPFYDGNDKDVVAVYESSFYFHGFVKQAYNQIKALNCDYYFFIGDDLILNPEFNETNIVEKLNMQNKKVFINDFDMIQPGFANWWHWAPTFVNFKYQGFHFKNYLPSRDDAYKKLNNFTGLTLPQYAPKPLPLKDFFTNHKNFMRNLKNLTDYLGKKALLLFVPIVRNKLIQIPYPCVSSYADYFMIKDDVLKKASDILAVFATMNVFVEVALATAIALTFDRNEVLLLKDTNYKDGAIWTIKEINDFAQKNNYSIEELFKNWEQKKLFYHPVKLSKWSLTAPVDNMTSEENLK